jgi:hypothetical protein
MKGSLGFDPRDHDYGPATDGIRTILATWEDIDWFEPGEINDDGVREYGEHQRLAHTHLPELFPNVGVQRRVGGWDDFAVMCRRVRGSGKWNWKFDALKQLSHGHALAHGWNVEEHTRSFPAKSQRLGELFFSFAPPPSPGFTDKTGKPSVFWTSMLPRLTELDLLPTDGTKSGRFYLSYAHGDLLDCIKWQLADPVSALSNNPFLPLLRCYSAGAYPFSLDRETVVLFRFVARQIPRAIARS